MSAIAEADALVELARRVLPPDARPEIDELAARLRQPLRIALAGRVKAGKSTLLNALVGTRLAATDARERTAVVTSYEWSHAPGVHVVAPDGTRVPVPFRREAGVLEPTLDGLDPARIARIEVSWPAPTLRSRVLIDTPGHGGVGAEGAPVEVRPLGAHALTAHADAVLYLMRHRHADDAMFLDAFADRSLGRPTPLTALGVLSRADEVGDGDLDALGVATRVAHDLQSSPELRALCQSVIPVCGLLAEGAVTMTDPEARSLMTIADADPAVRAMALRSVDDFRDEHLHLGVSVPEREALLHRFGIFGIRQAVDAAEHGTRSPSALADHLRRASGLDQLTQSIEQVFGARADLLRADRVLVALTGLADRYRATALMSRIEQARAGRHEWTEMAALVELRAGRARLPAELAATAERILGGRGADPAARVGCPVGTPVAAIADAAIAELPTWQAFAERPLSGPAEVALARAVIRTLEGLAQPR